MLNHADLPEFVKSGIKEFFAKNLENLSLLKYFFSYLYIHCRRKETKADKQAVKEAWKIIFPGGGPCNIFKDLAVDLEEFLTLWQCAEPASLVITSPWLKGWLYLKICSLRGEGQVLEVYLTGDKARRHYSPGETLAFFQHLAVLGLSLMHWMDLSHWVAEGKDPRDYPHGGTFAEVPQGPRAEMTALLYLIAEYAHIEGKLTRKAELFKTLEEVWANEGILYTIRDTYRDHINHMVETCLLGLLLMDLQRKGRPIPYFSRLPQVFARDKMIRCWILAALLHDTGYALEILQGSGQPLKFMDAPRLQKIAKEFDFWFKSSEKKALIRITECLGRALNWLEGYGLKKFDHGVTSAYFTLFLVSDRTKERPEPDQKWREDIRPALDAMARHNLKNLPTSYGTDPLSFLLILCDHLQEWDRPLVEGIEMRHSLVVHALGKVSSGIDKGSPVRFLVISRVFFQEGSLHLVDGPDPSFSLHFRESLKDRYHPPPTWLGTTYDFQSLADAPGEITLELVHPMRAGRGPEMDIFQTFLRQHPDLADLRDWVLQSRQGESWFKYQIKKDIESHLKSGSKVEPEEKPEEEKYEIFTFDLPKIKIEPIISQIPKDYFKKYMEFWKERFPST